MDDIENDNIDVFVELEDGLDYNYTVVVATAKNIEFLMDKENLNYFSPGYPFIRVKKLTEEIVLEAVKAYAENNGYWLKLCQFGDCLDIASLNKLDSESYQEWKRIYQEEKSSEE